MKSHFIYKTYLKLVFLGGTLALTNGCSPVKTELLSAKEKLNQNLSDDSAPNPGNPPPIPQAPPTPQPPPNPQTPPNQGPPITSTPPPRPFDCGEMDNQYKGVVPVGRDSNGFKTVRFNIQELRFKKLTYNYPISSEAQRQLDLIHEDIGGPFSMFREGPGVWRRVRIPANTVISWRFKTTEYLKPVYYRFSGVENPESPTGNLMFSISKCPGYFLSPDVISQTSGYDHYNDSNIFGDQKFRNCLGGGSSVSSGIEFGIGGDTRYICALEPNTTYYLNITAGQVDPIGQKAFPHIGTFDGTTQGYEQSQDFVFRPLGHQQSTGNIGNDLWVTPLIKNREAYYAEALRVRGLFFEEGQNYVRQCRALIAQSPTRTGRECSQLRPPMSNIRYE